MNIAAERLVEERDNRVPGNPQPGLAEYLDLLSGLQTIAPNDEAKQRHWLDRVYEFAYQKQS